MFNLQGSEIIFILLIALVVLGPEKLPDAVRRFTNTYNELRKMGSGLQSELRSVIDEPAQQVKETAAMLQDAANPDLFGSDGLPGDAAEFFDGETSDGSEPPVPEPDSPEPEGSDDAVGATSEADEAEPTPSAESPQKPINTIAAANSSAGLAARAEAAERADDPPAGVDSGAGSEAGVGVDRAVAAGADSGAGSEAEALADQASDEAASA